MKSKLVILVAIDLNPGSSLVLERALSMTSGRTDAELHVLTVSEPQVPLAAYPGMVPPPAVEGVDAEKVVAFCKKELDLYEAAHPNIKLPHVFVHTAVGVPADEVVWLAASLDADMIVVGTHGRRGLKRILLGSVAERVVRLAGCPVLTVRDKNHNAEWKVPEIEPLCDACAKERRDSAGKQLWCEMHRSRHFSTHVYGYSATVDAPARAIGAATGT
jgi:nucleotide-binding universal stress UspA family protein